MGAPELQIVMVAGIAIALVCGVLSPIVVLRRLAFVGQGVSHAAFGGVGIAAVLGITASGSSLTYLAVVAAFCIASALAIAALSSRSGARAGVSEDSAIGIILVGGMALGAALLHASADESDHGQSGHVHTPEIEEALFGSLMNVGRAEAGIAVVLSVLVIAGLWWIRRPLLFWALDEPGARAFGVSTGRVRAMLLVALALVIVLTMRLSGVVLATALLVLPGAAALRLSERLNVVIGLSVAVSLAGVLGGIGLSQVSEMPTGPWVVGVLIGLWALASAVGWLMMRSPGAARVTPTISTTNH